MREVPARMATRVLLTLALAAAVLMVVPTPAQAATFTVTSNRITGTAATDDPAPDGCNPGDCSLREAVLVANGTPGPDDITFESAGTVALGRFGTEANNASFNDLDVTEALTIAGHGGGTTIDGSQMPLATNSRIFEVLGTLLVLEQLELRDAETSGAGGAVRVDSGRLDMVLTTMADNATGTDGGAVFLASSELRADTSTFTGNRSAFNGGAVGSDDFTSINVVGSTFTTNATGQLVGAAEFVGGHGGAIDANGATNDASLTIEGSEFVDNVAIFPDQAARGGAIHLGNGEGLLTRVWLQGNGDNADGVQTDIGGAVAASGRLQLRNSSVVGNQANQFGGGVALEGGGLIGRSHIGDNTVQGGPGGGAYLATGNVQVENSTIQSNQSETDGAGVHVAPQALTVLTHVTLASNTGEAGLFIEAGAGAEVASSIVADHPNNCDGPTAPVSLDYNLEDADDCGFAAGNDLVNTPPQISPAADNGGDLQGVTPGQRGLTMALQPGSPAIDSSDPGLCGAAPFNVDQRGVARPQGPECDRGAYEAERDEPPPDNGDNGEDECDESAPGAIDPPITDGMNRVEGLNRVQTAIVASMSICGDGEAPAVVLTRSDLFPDAQAGTPLAVQLGAPLLLSQPAELNPDTEDEIERILDEGKTVYLLGGTAALSEAVEQRLQDIGYETVRYGGVNRFETAQIIAEDGLDNPDTILLANGGDFADSVIAGAAAATFRDADDDINAAVLLTSGEDRSPFTEEHLDGRTDDPDLVAIGAAAAAAYPDVDDVVGPTRFETGVLVAERFFTNPVAVGIARADEFADALTGGAIIGRPEIGPGPMLLVATDLLPPAVEDYLTDNAASIDKAVIFGGEAAVNADVENEIAAALGF